jgi:hypothetical protein
VCSFAFFSYKALLVLYKWAISGTNGSSNNIKKNKLWMYEKDAHEDIESNNRGE